jgi:hypothetical protein
LRLKRTSSRYSTIFSGVKSGHGYQQWNIYALVIFAALEGYSNEEVALNTGMALREMLRHEQLAKILLYSEQ